MYHKKIIEAKRNLLLRYFTLIELLVAIAIIAILASMLQPSLRRAMQSAKSVACNNHLRQVGELLEIYKSDHNEYYPYFEVIPFSYNTAWFVKLIQQIDEDYTWSNNRPSGKVLMCPEVEADYVPTNNQALRCSYKVMRGGFVYFNSSEAPGGANPYNIPLDTKSITSPSDKGILIGEATISNLTWRGYSATGLYWDIYNMQHLPWTHPSQSVNVLFADTHIENVFRDGNYFTPHGDKQ